MMLLHIGSVPMVNATQHAWATTPAAKRLRRNFITTNARDVRNLDF